MNNLIIKKPTSDSREVLFNEYLKMQSKEFRVYARNC